MKPREPSAPASPGESPSAAPEDPAKQRFNAAFGAWLFVAIWGTVGLYMISRYWWISLVTPWGLMALGGLPVSVIFLVWAWQLDNVRPLIVGGLGSVAFVSAAALTMSVLYIVNGFFDRGVVTPYRAVVLSVGRRESKIRVELPSGPVETRISDSSGMQNGDTLALYVSHGALGIPIYRPGDILCPPRRDRPGVYTCPSNHQETPR